VAWQGGGVGATPSGAGGRWSLPTYFAIIYKRALLQKFRSKWELLFNCKNLRALRPSLASRSWELYSRVVTHLVLQLSEVPALFSKQQLNAGMAIAS